MCNKIYCKNCVGWYRKGSDLCVMLNPLVTPSFRKKSDLYNSISGGGCVTKEFLKAVGYSDVREGLSDSDNEKYLFGKKKSLIGYGNEGMRYIYGHPSIINNENNCLFYRERLIVKIKKLFK